MRKGSTGTLLGKLEARCNSNSKGIRDENMREIPGQGGRGMQWESNGRDILIERAFMG